MCKAWGVPYVSLDETDTTNIYSLVKDMVPQPRVILSTVSRVTEEAVQQQLRRLPIRKICLDEVQVNKILWFSCYTCDYRF